MYLVYVVVGDLAAVVVEPQEVNRQLVAIDFIACARARGTWISKYRKTFHWLVNKVWRLGIYGSYSWLCREVDDQAPVPNMDLGYKKWGGWGNYLLQTGVCFNLVLYKQVWLLSKFYKTFSCAFFQHEFSYYTLVQILKSKFDIQIVLVFHELF